MVLDGESLIFAFDDAVVLSGRHYDVILCYAMLPYSCPTLSSAMVGRVAAVEGVGVVL